jgi:hypothetical protein
MRRPPGIMTLLLLAVTCLLIVFSANNDNGGEGGLGLGVHYGVDTSGADRLAAQRKNL